MSVLLKYQLKALFESGDLMTQDTLVDLIDSTYNPILVAGTNISLGSVTTPSGTTITVNAAGGGSGVVTNLTTTGTSGLATLSSGILNIPNYSNIINSLSTSGSSGAATLIAGVLNIPIYGNGDTYSLTAGVKVNTSVPLNLDAAAGADTSVKLTEGNNITLTRTSATEIKIDSTGGGGATGAQGPQGPQGAAGTQGPQGPTGIATATTGATALNLQNVVGVYHDMGSANTATTYTISPTPTTLGGFARVLINSTSQPSVTSATLIKGDTFAPSINMYMTAQWNGNRVEYWFEQIAP